MTVTTITKDFCLSSLCSTYDLNIKVPLKTVLIHAKLIHFFSIPLASAAISWWPSGFYEDNHSRWEEPQYNNQDPPGPTKHDHQRCRLVLSCFTWSLKRVVVLHVYHMNHLPWCHLFKRMQNININLQAVSHFLFGRQCFISISWIKAIIWYFILELFSQCKW